MRTVAAAFLLLGSLAPGQSLGQSLGSLAVHREALQQRHGFAVIEVQGARGTVIRKFVAPSGIIFGIAWQGPAVPDLRVLLGSRFAAFQQALQQQPRHPRRRGPLYVKTHDLVVQNGGHMRAFVGRVYLTDVMPAGFPARVIH